MILITGDSLSQETSVFTQQTVGNCVLALVWEVCGVIETVSGLPHF